MKILRVVLSSNRLLINALLVFCLVPVVAGAGGASDQKDGKVVIKHGSTIEIWPDTTIPEATEPCTAEVSEWWQQIRKANSDLFQGYKKRSEKSVQEARARFFLLLHEGQQKAYRVPLKDRPPQILVFGKTTYPYIARKNKIEGGVELSVEFKSDGLIGDVRIVKELGWGLDQTSIEAARRIIFLPAIKDGAFVTYRDDVEYGFDLPGGIAYKPSKK
jgi:TonB family protein